MRYGVVGHRLSFDHDGLSGEASMIDLALRDTKSSLLRLSRGLTPLDQVMDFSQP